MTTTEHEVTIAANIIHAEASTAIASAETLEEKFRAAFKKAGDYWMSTNPDIRFKGGIGAVLISIGSDHPEHERICIELEQLKILNAMLSGVPVNFDAIPEPPEGHKPIGITKIWKEVNPQ